MSWSEEQRAVRNHLRALAELDLSDPDVAHYLHLVRRQEAKPEENLREKFLAPLLGALGYRPASEFHLATGDADYALPLSGDKLAAVEVKAPAFNLRADAYRCALGKSAEEKKKYLEDPRVEYLVLTDALTWMFFSRSELRGGAEPFYVVRSEQLIGSSSPDLLERLGPDRLADTLARARDEGKRADLAERFYRALSRWVELLCGNLQDGSPESRRASILLLNKFLFVRTLEDLGCVRHRDLARRLLEAVERRKPSKAVGYFLKDLNEWFYDYYDTEIFHEVGTENVSVDALKAVLLGAPGADRLFGDDLYSFNFAALDVDVLGHVYERYLAGLRRERGIYYTRHEVVEGIVERTVGALVDRMAREALEPLREGHLEESRRLIQERLLSLRVLDPACGSGSFLIAAYRRIVAVYQDWEKQFKERLREQVSAAQANGSQLSLTQPRAPDEMPKRLLVACIFGIDLDPGAVGVAKLNLWLAMVRANPAAFDWQNLQGHETNHVLPPLKVNVFCANSLLGPPRADVIAAAKESGANLHRIRNLRGQVAASFGPNRDALEEGIPEIIRGAHEKLRAAGIRLPEPAFFYDVELHGIEFDAIIGNPPYIGEEDHKEIFRLVKDWPFLADAYEGKMDYAFFFLHLGERLLKAGGRLGYILPIYFEKAEGAAGLNRMLAQRMTLEEFFFFGDVKVFKESAPGQHNVVLLARKEPAPENRPRVARVRDVSDEAAVWRAFGGEDLPAVRRYEAPAQRELVDDRGAMKLAPAAAEEICKRMAAQPNKLADVFLVNQGVVTGPNDVGRKAIAKLVREERKGEGEPSDEEIEDYCERHHLEIGEGVFVLSRDEVRKLELSPSERKLLRPFHFARDIAAFDADPEAESQLLYLSEKTCPDIARFPRVAKHLARFREIMERRRETEEEKREWFQLHWPREESIFLKPKIVTPRQTPESAFAYVPDAYYVDLACQVLTAHAEASDESLRAWTAVLNSAPVCFWLYHRGKRKGEMLQLDRGPLDEVPVPAALGEAQEPLARASERLSALVRLRREAPVLIGRLARASKTAMTIRALLESRWCDPLATRTSGKRDEPGEVTVVWRGLTVVLSTRHAEHEAVFTSSDRARWAAMVIEAALRARTRKATSLAAALDTPLPVEAGPGQDEPTLERNLAHLDRHAESVGAAPFDLVAYDEEISRLRGEIDGIVAGLYRLDDVPLDLLRRPGDAY